MTFTTNIGKGQPDNPGYAWSITAGTIESGQGTAAIRVRTTPDMRGSNVTAMVKIRGVGEGCVDTASETAGIAQMPPVEPVDEFGTPAKHDMRARIDNLFIHLRHDPRLEALLIVHLNPKDSTAVKRSYLNNIYGAIVFLKNDPSRVTFVIAENESEARTVVYIIYPKGDPKENGSKSSMVIKGEEFKQKIKTLFPINK